MKAQTLGWLALLWSAACDSEGIISTPNPPPPPPAPIGSAGMAAFSKQEWRGITGEYFTEPFAVRVSRGGQGIAGQTVSWRVTVAMGELGSAPGQILSSGLTTTNENGVAQVFYRPLSDGISLITASVAELSGSPVTFTVRAGGRGEVVIPFGPLFDCYGTPNTQDQSRFEDPQTTLPVGTTVKFVYAAWLPSSCSAQIVSTRVPPGGRAFDSGYIPAGGSFVFVFDVAGDWEYKDALNGGTGKVTVR